ncbi:MAG TPA: DinB family protein [Bryobacteraceae bacterium]|nr:DinB family protein [Bryobacteraceae bacterium]
MTEPWLNGPIEGVPPHLMPVFHSFAMVREDLARYTEGLTTEDVWRRTGSLPSLGFHLRHMGESVDRLVSYLCGEQLSETQIATLKQEGEPGGASLAELLAGVDAKLAAAESRLRTIAKDSMEEPRYIGKKRLPSTVLGLLVHIAEHTQRHLGQAITTAKLARETRA